MKLGGPGDHWYTDLFNGAAREVPVFSDTVDTLLREIRRFGGDALMQEGQPLAQRLWAVWPRWHDVDEESLRLLAVDLAGPRPFTGGGRAARVGPDPG